MALVLCGGCARHVREIESCCPFCGRERTASESDVASVEMPTRLSRAAILLAGAMSAAACDRQPVIAQPYGAPPREAIPDTGVVVVEPVFDAPVAVDAGAPEADASAEPADVATSRPRASRRGERPRTPNMRLLYGAPAAAYGASPEFKRTDDE